MDALLDAIASTYTDELDGAIDNDTFDIDEYINSNWVILNGFQFCKDHGNEYCTKCEGDTRLLNNEELPKSTYKRLKKSIWAGIDPRKRPPIRDVYARFKPIPTGEIHPFRRSEFYACETHRDIDCAKCFNWAEILQEKAQKEGTVADRGQILGLLKLMGIELSPNTKMKDNVLEKKLSGALTASQSLSSFAPSSINPLELTLWTVRALNSD
ncbi:hypothetical protein BDZ89DRAFT_964076 [Hymenopellis radicata]|nr:hypothetical protein BDZ89DRAFT_964076 [Hymenopellis radicata]